jgi:hypothetical protein
VRHLARLGVHPWAAAGGVIAAWRSSHVKGLWLGGQPAEETQVLDLPAVTCARKQLCDRLSRQVWRS